MVNKSEIDEIWEKGKTIPDKNSDAWRKDANGNLIRKASYGTNGEYAWEIDHKKPISKGGSDSIKNIQPLHKQENREKSDKYPYKKK